MTIGNALSNRMGKAAATAAFLLITLLFTLALSAFVSAELIEIVGEKGTSISVEITSKSTSFWTNFFQAQSIIPPLGLGAGETFTDTLEFYGTNGISPAKIKLMARNK